MMVAYSFQRRFAPPISTLVKRQTIRADRRRHARPGEMLQLFTGMRTRHCAKIIADPRCLSVEPIVLRMDSDGCIAEAEIGECIAQPVVRGGDLMFLQRQLFAVEAGALEVRR